MPKIRWKDLPPALREHLFDRLRERKISPERVFGDVELGAAIRRAERLEATRAREAMLQAISDRYSERSL